MHELREEAKKSILVVKSEMEIELQSQKVGCLSRENSFRTLYILSFDTS